MTNSRRKGAAGELELVNLFKDYGFEAERTAQRSGKTGVADIELPQFSRLHIEVKRRKGNKNPIWSKESLKAMAQAQRDKKTERHIPVVIGRSDYEMWNVMIPLEDFMDMLALIEHHLLKH